MDSKSISEAAQSGGGITGADWAAFSTSIWRALQALQTGGSPQAGGAWNAGDAVSINGNLELRQLPSGRGQHLTAGDYNNDDEILETVQEVQINTSSFIGAIRHGRRHVQPDQQEWNHGWHGSGYGVFLAELSKRQRLFQIIRAPKLITKPPEPLGPGIPNPASQVPYLR